MKMTPRIPPKNASTFAPGNVIRLEFPAQGYVNPGKTTLEFDVVLEYDALDGETSYVRFQNNVSFILIFRFNQFSLEYDYCMELLQLKIFHITMLLLEN
jgi:hypothetical protein